MVAETGYPRQGGLSHFDERSMPSPIGFQMLVAKQKQPKLTKMRACSELLCRWPFRLVA